MICPRYFRGMTKGLERWYGGHDLHFITCSCYQRRPELATCERRDFNVSSSEKRIEKLRYMHRNPVKRGLVTAPEDWKWSSFRAYACGEGGLVRVNCQEWPLTISYFASRSHSFENRSEEHTSELQS